MQHTNPIVNQAYTHTRVLITGGAGFIGSHLTDRLLELGVHVIVVDNFITGNKNNLESALQSEHCTLIEADVSNPDYLKNLEPRTPNPELIFHLASPASPDGYMNHPVETYMVNSMGTHHLANFAKEVGAKMLYTSTSEAYGDPLQHPQTEDYWGNVNPVGPRACYDESKRFGEMVMMNAIQNNQLDGRIVRIFNTYGPRMDPNDGRVIPNFASQALLNQPITIHGDGTQTRSFCYVADLVEFLLRAMSYPKTTGEVINIGNPDEYTMQELAEEVKQAAQSDSELQNIPSPREEDPKQRCPDISKAKRLLEYEPSVSLKDGLQKTVEFFSSELS